MNERGDEWLTRWQSETAICYCRSAKDGLLVVLLEPVQRVGRTARQRIVASRTEACQSKDVHSVVVCFV